MSHRVLKISRQERPLQGVTLRLEGTLAGPWVKELLEECERVLAAHGRVRLDLSGLAFVDQEGARLLAGLPADQVQLANPSVFVVEILKRGGT